MGSDQDPQPLATDQRQQRARSLPFYEARTGTTKTMGNAYRTPSPLREPFYASGKWIDLDVV
jgi:hypothetical protein